MKLLNGRWRLTAFVVATGAVILDAGVAFAGGAAVTPSASPGSAVATVFAMGLVNPRGLKFGPDGKLYVAEGGISGRADDRCAPRIGWGMLGRRWWTWRIFRQHHRLTHLEDRRRWACGDVRRWITVQPG